MRKKELFEQNAALFERLQSTVAQLEKYKRLYNENIEEINMLRKQLADMEISAETAEQPEIHEEETVETAEELPPVDTDFLTEYSSRVIGNIILEGTKISNNFSSNPNEYSKDLINLVLGKTEVAKSAIFEILHSEKSDDDKKSEIDAVCAEAVEYFSNLTKQI